jgi:small-conductance mechanosensitive channel
MPEILKSVNWNLIWKVFAIFLTFVVLYLISFYFLEKIRKKFLERVKTKKEKSNIEIFLKATEYFLFLLFLIFIFLAFGGSLTGIGVVAGLLSAALGWALQRPITGIAAWLMIIIKRPFEIGDRVTIGDIKGDVADITLTHIHIKEIGGTIISEESSGRIILIPNAKLFEQDIINYTLTDELILDQAKFTVTYESDLRETEKISLEATKEILSKYLSSFQQPYVRFKFRESGIGVFVRYQTPAPKREEVLSKITEKIFEKIKNSNKVEFAYPHQEVILKKKE